MDLAISVLALATALSTPLPRYFDLSASRSSSASCSPVEAPEGTAARPSAPPSSTTSASTVGLPRESRTCRPWTRAILVDMLPPERNLRRNSNLLEPQMNTDKHRWAEQRFLPQRRGGPSTPALRAWTHRERRPRLRLRSPGSASGRPRGCSRLWCARAG